MATRTFYLVNFGADYEKEEERVIMPRMPEDYTLQEGEGFGPEGEITNKYGSRIFANAVCSRTAEDENIHLPAIDIDVPIKVVPSRTEGHFHLYIDKPMEWKQYLILLLAMEAAGIVETGYVSVCMQRRSSYLRLSEETPR